MVHRVRLVFGSYLIRLSRERTPLEFKKIIAYLGVVDGHCIIKS